MASIIPVAKSLYLCDRFVGYSGGKVDLYGLFNSIQPKTEFPYIHSRFSAFAQLANGLGQVPFYIDIRHAESDKLAWTTQRRELSFPDRHTVVQVALNFENCRFDRPGVYLLELFCDNTWICDTQLLLR